MQLIVDSIGTGLGALSRGDLTTEVTAELDGPVARLKVDFNGALAHLRRWSGPWSTAHRRSIADRSKSHRRPTTSPAVSRALIERFNIGGKPLARTAMTAVVAAAPVPAAPTQEPPAKAHQPGPAAKPSASPAPKAYRSPVKALPRTNGAAAVATDSESWDAF